MLSFAQYTALNEGTYPAWVKATVGAMVLKVRNLSTRIEREPDPVQQNRLIAQQNKLLAYMGGLGVAVSTNDPQLIMKIRSKR
ncbi:hypothetical protein QWJ17_04540 [Betaproteobacteria bacterium LSUCC0117]|nr:hypothetical protein [Betaproteobacteria bacterium LSUCC0117]